jgi:hypothetical protein
MTLLTIVTTAPPLKSALGGISISASGETPLAGERRRFGAHRVMPPVIVTLDRDGRLGHCLNSPIVTTRAAALMIVRLAPAPTSLTLTSIVRAVVRAGADPVVSPSSAAARAGASCVYGQPLDRRSALPRGRLKQGREAPPSQASAAQACRHRPN